MSATDELRRLLDERGVEWTEPNNMARSHTTYWTAGFLRCGAVEFNDGMVSIASSSDDITPEQAIEATLGRGVCHVERMPKDQNLRCGSWLACSECGRELPTLVPANYCPNCGRKVVDA